MTVNTFSCSLVCLSIVTTARACFEEPIESKKFHVACMKDETASFVAFRIRRRVHCSRRTILDSHPQHSGCVHTAVRRLIDVASREARLLAARTRRDSPRSLRAGQIRDRNAENRQLTKVRSEQQKEPSLVQGEVFRIRKNKFSL